HFGHKTKRWNPRMAPYLFGVRGDIHIIDLQQTLPLLHKALTFVRDTVANNGRVLFVGTKQQAQEPIAEMAKRCGQYYVNHRWLGGMLTNWRTVSNSIKALKKLEEQLGNDMHGLSKKEVLNLTRQREKLERSLGGIKDMGGLPDIIFLIDTNVESLAISEAQKLGIPVVAILDSNSSPDGITYPVPGNDDSTKAIRLYCRLVSDAVLSGIQREMEISGVDIGESAEIPAGMQAKVEAASAADLAKLTEAKGPEVKVKKSRAKKADTEEAPAEEEAKAEEAPAKKTRKKA
ncbi:MAG: 30S ribosomal protein S2, partial [Alphaproteobacteria bacterium]|nr:30S ribosomal protein S2 [Alphaproteobacteria bacterium]